MSINTEVSPRVAELATKMVEDFKKISHDQEKTETTALKSDTIANQSFKDIDDEFTYNDANQCEKNLKKSNIKLAFLSLSLPMQVAALAIGALFLIAVASNPITFAIGGSVVGILGIGLIGTCYSIYKTNRESNKLKDDVYEYTRPLSEEEEQEYRLMKAEQIKQKAEIFEANIRKTQKEELTADFQKLTKKLIENDEEKKAFIVHLYGKNGTSLKLNEIQQETYNLLETQRNKLIKDLEGVLKSFDEIDKIDQQKKTNQTKNPINLKKDFDILKNSSDQVPQLVTNQLHNVKKDFDYLINKSNKLLGEITRSALSRIEKIELIKDIENLNGQINELKTSSSLEESSDQPKRLKEEISLEKLQKLASLRNELSVKLNEIEFNFEIKKLINVLNQLRNFHLNADLNDTFGLRFSSIYGRIKQVYSHKNEHQLGKFQIEAQQIENDFKILVQDLLKKSEEQYEEKMLELKEKKNSFDANKWPHDDLDQSIQYFKDQKAKINNPSLIDRINVLNALITEIIDEI